MRPFLDELYKQLELKLFVAEILRQFKMPKWMIFKVLGFTKYQIHVFNERAKVTKDLWFKVMKYHNWKCACCGLQNFFNENMFIDKMELDHIQPVSRWGYSTWNNLQVLCRKCNRSKSTGPRCKLHA